MKEVESSNLDDVNSLEPPLSMIHGIECYCESTGTDSNSGEPRVSARSGIGEKGRGRRHHVLLIREQKGW